MSSVDDRIVNMQFNNKQFQTGAADSTKSLQTLEQTIGDMGKSGNGLDNVAKGVDGLSGKFSALQVAGVTALATIVNKAVNAGLQFAKSFTLGPILDGFHEYEKTLNSTQTILANTGLEGKKGLAKVGSALKQLNDYSDLTIYNFSQMADSVGKFTAAGVPLKESISAIKGLANSAALSGSSVDQLNTAMYQMSQALSTGTIRLMDWNSLANAGMGGSNIRKALMATNRTIGDHGKAMDAAIKAGGSFRDSLQAGWLDSETFTKTMKVMAGVADDFGGKTLPYTVKQLRGMGYAKDAAVQLHKLSGAAIESATKVKTFSQLIDVVKESIGSGWAKVFEDLFGNFGEATKLWTHVSDVITGAVGNIFKQVDKILLGWKKLGGFQDMWNGFGNIFKTIGNLLTPFVAAFKAVFPATQAAGSGLAKFSSGFESVTGWLEKATRGLDVLTPILTTVFGVFKQIGSIAASAVDGLAPLIGLISSLASELGGLAKQGADIGQNIIGGLLKGLDPEKIKMAVESFANNIVVWIKNALGIHSPAAELVPVGQAIVQGIAQGIVSSIQFVISSIQKVLDAIFQGLKDFFTSGDIDAVDWVSLFNVALLGALIVTIRKFIHSFGGVVTSIAGTFNQLTDTLKTMQSEVKAAIILQIAIAVGILTAALIALSFIGPKKIAIGLGALATMVALLVGALGAMSKIDSKDLYAMSVALLSLSTSVGILTAAIVVLSAINPDKLNQGLTAVAAGMALFIGTLAALTKLATGPGLAVSAGAIITIAQAMAILTASVVVLSAINPDKLNQGLTAVAAGLALFVGTLAALSKFATGPALAESAGAIIVLAQALAIMAGAVVAMGLIDGEQLAHGMEAIAVGLALMIGSLFALSKIGPGVAAGAAAIITMAQAMAIMAGALLVLGAQKGDDLAKGIMAIAAALGVFLLAAFIASQGPVAAGLIVLGLAAVSLGAGLFLAGAGMLAAATAISILAIAGTAGIAVLAAGFQTLLSLLPAFAVSIASAIVLFIEAIASMAPRLRVAFGEIIASMIGTLEDSIPHIQTLASQIIASLLEVLKEAIPEVADVVQAYIDAFIGVLTDSTNDIVNAALSIIDNFLTALGKHVKSIIEAGTAIIIAVIRGLGKASKEIADAAGQTILDFINGLTTAINTYAPQIRDAALRLAWAIITGLTGGLLSADALRSVLAAVTGLAGKAIDGFKHMFGIHSPSKEAHWWGEMIVKGLVNGITDNIKNAVGATVMLANAMIAAGDKKVAEAQKAAAKRQIAADKAAAKSKVSDQIANKAEKAAKKDPNSASLKKAAEAARKIADKNEKAASAAQKRAEAANEHVTSVKDFQAADNSGKGDILTAKAAALSDRAVKALALANAEATAAKKLRGKERDDMLKAAKEDARAAKALADRSKHASESANKYYAKNVQERIKAFNDARQATADQAKFDASTPAEQADILQAKADAAKKRSEAAMKASEALVEKAKKLAKTDAKKAQALLDRAEALANDADKAADDAKGFADQAQQITGSSTGANFQLSPSIIEQAAAAVDRMTESLREAETAAAAAPSVVQFEQNNYSPEALSPAEVYRGTKNLLSLAEIKMAESTP